MKKIKINTTSFIITLVVFYTAIIALLWQQVARQVNEDKKETIAASVKHHNNLVFALEQNTIRTLQEAEVVLQLVKTEVEKSDTNISLEQLLSRGISKLPFFEGLAVIDDKGKIVNTYPVSLRNQNVDLSQRDYFKIEKAIGDTLYISKPFISSSLNKPVVVISRRVNNKKGKFAGVIAVQILPSTFMAFYREATLNRFDILSLISPDGITYSRRTGDIESNGENISKSPLFQHLRKTPYGSYYAKDAIRNIPTYFSYRKLKNYPVIATVGSSEDEVLREFSGRKRREYTFGAILTGLLLGFFVFVFIIFLQRRKAIRTLMSNEARYRSIFQGSRDAIFLLGPCGRVEAANRSGRKLFKIESSAGDLHFTQLYVTSSSFQQFYNGLVANEEVLFERFDGSKFVGEIAASSFRDADHKEHFLLLIRNVSARKRMEKQLASERKKHQSELTRHIITAQESEREVIGRELHDNVNQVLTTVKLYLETALTNTDNKDVLIKHSIGYVQQSIHEIRNLSHSLTAPTLGTHSLIDSIKVLAEDVSTASGIQVAFEAQEVGSPISKDQGLALYRIVQEQLSNIIKHSGGTHVVIKLHQTADETKLLIQDNGKGFSMNVAKKGIGIHNMESRALAFGGRFLVNSAPGAGCIIEVGLPLNIDPVERKDWNG